MSVNWCWKWRRFKTQEYKDYTEEVLWLLKKYPNIEIDIKKDQTLRIILQFWVSSKNCDIDNPVKPFLDILQLAFWFNDKQVYKLEVTKLNVPKWEEFINFDILPL